MNLLTHQPELVLQGLDQRRRDLAQANRPQPRRIGARRTRIRAGASVLGVLIGFAAADQARAAIAETRLVSETQFAAADDYSDEPAISADGRFVAFTSLATNLSDGDGDGVRDIFVRDMEEETVVLASRSAGHDGAGGQYDSFAPSISANGRFVAFASHEDEFTDEDEDGLDVFVRDLKEGTTILVSRASGASGDGGDAASSNPAISANGRYVAFESEADNLGEVATAHSNIFVRDLDADRTTLVSRKSGRRGTRGNNDSVEPSISGGGRYVAFTSSASNLSSADDNLSDDIFVRDLGSNETELASRRGKSGPGGDAGSFAPAISVNGRMLAFASGADNLDPAGDDGFTDIFVRNLTTSKTALVSRRSGANGAKAKDNSFEPSISADGNAVSFWTFATNLSGADSDSWDDVFVRDLDSDRTRLASRASGANGAGADGTSGPASISADGRFLAFASAANNLTDDDAAGIPDVFRRDLRERKSSG